MTEFVNQKNNMQTKAQESVKTSKNTFWSDLDGVGTLGLDLLKGAVKEVEDHPLKIAADVGIGLATSVAVSAYPILAVPVLTVGLVELVANHKKIMKTTDFLAHDFYKIENPKKYSLKDIKMANQNFEELGGTLTQFAAGFAGGIGGSYIGSIAKDSIRSLISASFSKLEGNLDSLGLVDAASSKFTALKTTIKSISDQEIHPTAKLIMSPTHKGSSLLSTLTNGHFHFTLANTLTPLAAIHDAQNNSIKDIKILSQKIEHEINTPKNDSINPAQLKHQFQPDSYKKTPLKTRIIY